MSALPPDFLWGVATSGYQCEGGYNLPGLPHNNWAAAEASRRVQPTGQAARFWELYEEDFARCRSIGLNAFRLSLEWSRVQPSTTDQPADPPPFSQDAIDGYADRLAACRRHGLEPVVTLHHFTHPAWLGLDAWLRDDTPRLFEAFAVRAVEGINRRLATKHGEPPLRWFVTINEPNMLVLNTYLTRHFPGVRAGGMAVGVRAYNRLLCAHVRAYNALHDLYESRAWPPPRITMNTFCSDAYWSEQMLLDLLLSRERGIARTDIGAYLRDGSGRLRRALAAARLPFRSDPFVWIGRAVHLLVNLTAPAHATGETFGMLLDELDRSKRTRVLDFLGLDYYDPFTGHLFRAPRFHDIEARGLGLPAHLMAGLSRKWWDWHMLPEGLNFFCRHYAREFPGLGILIAENGMAVRCNPDGSACEARRDNLTRSLFLEAHVAQILRLAAEGVPMLGYLHWSLTDNYEWGSFSPRFGLYAIDYTDHARRLPTGHRGDNAPETYARLIRQEGSVNNS